MISNPIAAAHFDYRTEPYRGALLITGALLVLTAFAPLLLLRLVLLAIVAGPGAWALLQWRRPALLIAGVLLVLTAFAPLLLLRLVLLTMAAGPGAWALLQWRRGGRGIRLEEADLAVQPSFVGRTRTIPYSALQNFMLTPRGQLVLAYQKPDKKPAAQAGPPHALTEIRPETHQSGPRYGLIVTATVGKPGDLMAALSAHAPLSPEPYFSADDLKAWMRRRRVRNLILILLAVLATPLYVVLIGRFVASVQSIGVYTSGR